MSIPGTWDPQIREEVQGPGFVRMGTVAPRTLDIDSLKLVSPPLLGLVSPLPCRVTAASWGARYPSSSNHFISQWGT
jgi:hypothetical protein